jgi:hypothetical protein
VNNYCVAPTPTPTVTPTQPTATATPTPTPVPRAAPCGKPGDITGDGYISVEDYSLAYGYIGSTSLNADQLARVDVDANGVAGFNDVAVISSYLERDISTFAACTVPTPIVTPTAIVTPVPTPICIPSNGDCSVTGACCTGLSCNLVGGDGKCGTPCGEVGSTCNTASPCCSQFSCSSTGSCVTPPEICVSTGFSCASTACCNGLVCDSSTKICMTNYAQAILSGYVSDTNGFDLSGVSITVSGPTISTISKSTGSNGGYSFSIPMKDVYASVGVSASKTGYTSSSVSISVFPAYTQTQDFVLSDTEFAPAILRTAVCQDTRFGTYIHDVSLSCGGITAQALEGFSLLSLHIPMTAQTSTCFLTATPILLHSLGEPLIFDSGIGTVSLTAGQTTEQLIVGHYYLDGSILFGSVKDSAGNGLGGVSISVDGYGITTNTTVSASNGNYQLIVPGYSDNPVIRVSAPGFTGSTAVTELNEVAVIDISDGSFGYPLFKETSRRINLTGSFANVIVSGTVKDNTGAGIAGATVTIPSTVSSDSVSGLSNNDGTYSLSVPVRASRVTVIPRAEKNGYTSANGQSVILTSGSPTTNANVVLFGAAIVSGRVANPDNGYNMNGVIVYCGSNYAISNNLGEYSISIPMTASTGSCILSVQTPDFTVTSGGTGSVSLTASRTTNVAMIYGRFPSVTVTGNVINSAGTSLTTDFAYSSLYGQSGGFNLRQSPFSYTHVMNSREDVLNMVISKTGSPTVDKTINLVAGTNIDLGDIPLVSVGSARISGTVKNSAGTGIVGVRVSCGGNSTMSTITGAYTLIVPMTAATGSCTLDAYTPDFTISSGTGTKMISTTTPITVNIVGNYQAMSCPANWVLVHGAEMKLTNQFCVMKYEAKNVGGVATSQAAGTPWVSISQDNARAACAALGSSYHLITDREWVTLADEISNVPANWQNNVVGGGCLYGGHMDTSGSILAAAVDTDPYYGTGNTAAQSFVCPFGGSGKEQRRTFSLYDGSVIWDLSGNANEMTYDRIPGYLLQQPYATPCSDSGYTQYPQIGSLQMLEYARPSDRSWSASQGVGRILQGWCTPTDRVFLRGQVYLSSPIDYSGLWNLDVRYTPSEAISPKIGFRCAYGDNPVVAG